MASYHLWHPAYIASKPLTLECFVTLGDAFFLSRGTDDFVQAALRAIGLDVETDTWRFDAMRTPYFSSYRGVTGDWEDDWALAWRLRAQLKPTPAPAPPAAPSWGYFDLEAVDKSFDPLDHPDRWQGWHGLVLADAPDLAVIDAVRDILRRRYPQAECVLGKAFSRDPQLRCDLGFRKRTFFESGAAEFEDLLTRLVEAGASVRFDHGQLR